MQTLHSHALCKTTLLRMLLVLILTLMAGCSTLDPKRIVSAIDPAILEIERVSVRASSDLEMTRTELVNLGNRLIEYGLPQAAAFVRTTLADGIARVGIEYRCNAVFTSQRIKDSLSALIIVLKGAMADGRPLEEQRVPYLCSANPSAIMWTEAPQVVKFNGFDINSDPERNGLSATILGPDGSERAVPPHALAAGPFEVNLNLSPSGAAFPINCSKLAISWNGQVVYEVTCATQCPPPPPPRVVLSADTKIFATKMTSAKNCYSGCKHDEDFLGSCNPGYTRIGIEANVTGGKGRRHCGASSNLSPEGGGPRTRWLSNDPADCSFHAHSGVDAGWGNYVDCSYVVTERRPEKIVQDPAPVLGWCGH